MQRNFKKNFTRQKRVNFTMSKEIIGICKVFFDNSSIFVCFRCFVFPSERFFSKLQKILNKYNFLSDRETMNKLFFIILFFFRRAKFFLSILTMFIDIYSFFSSLKHSQQTHFTFFRRYYISYGKIIYSSKVFHV